MDTMFEQLRGNWGWVLLRGVAAVIFGVLAFVWPGVTLVVLALMWGAYALVDGVFALVAGFRVRDQGRPVWPFVLVGIAGLAAGIASFMWPGLTAFALLMFIAGWAIVMGLFQIAAAIRLRKEIDHEWMLILSGVLSVLFGALMVLAPGAGALAVVWLIAAYSIVFGAMLIALAFRLRKLSPADHSGSVGRARA